MCGIAGFWTGACDADVARAALTRMTDALVHRGPDASGAWIDACHGIALGHRRLAIVDLSPLGQQPMESASGRFWLVFNGEIYNYRALRETLHSQGVEFRSHSDTEVLLALIERDGFEAALGQCVGMFAIALWDRHTRRLALGRDRFGEKPLYLGRRDGGLAFASELSALRTLPGVSSEIEPAALAAYLRHGYVPAPMSMLRDVVKLEPGTIATFSTPDVNQAQFTRYWSVRDTAVTGLATTATGTDDDRIERLDTLLRGAVADQMVADVPLGAFLSGGIDSSLIVALMQAQSARPVRTFTIGFRESAFDEAPHAAAVARHIGTEHTTMFVTAQDALDVIPRLPSIYNEPFADSSQIPTVLVSQLAREHVTVALSGDGGDELFGGYSRYPLAMRSWPRLTRLPYSMRRATSAMVTSIGVRTWNHALGPLGLMSRGVTGDRVHKLATLIDTRSFPDFYCDLVSAWRQPQDLMPGVVERDTAIREPFTPGRGGLLADMMFRDQVSYLPDDILVKVDRAAMAAGLETRAPLLDHRVAEFAWQLPQNCWQRDGQGKWIVRRVLDRYVPRTLIDRPKQGFGVPIADWLRGPLRDWASELLSPEALRRDGIFRTEPVLQTWKEHLSGDRNWAPSLWYLLMFQAWRRS
ncbi:asparagine synthase (glutamine-hydrolyzing) [Gemmatimonas sp.]|uniref:asparagine synthase (glutamine-hydrolyzing) n=1 Tax=Gemmatimonas sp. TaxID=1962908 RepID=UPI003983D8CA